MTAGRMEIIIDEVEHSLAMESLAMTEAEKDNLRRVGRGALSYQDFIAEYVATAWNEEPRNPKRQSCSPSMSR